MVGGIVSRSKNGESRHYRLIAAENVILITNFTNVGHIQAIKKPTRKRVGFLEPFR
jgi:hypothetical protein